MRGQKIKRKQARRLKWSQRTTGRLSFKSPSLLGTKMLIPSAIVLGKFLLYAHFSREE